MVKIAYVDSSILVKHYVESERNSTRASKIITAHMVYVSSITQVEIFSALARKLQLGEASIEDVERIKGAFLEDCQRIGIIEISNDVITEAQALAFRAFIKTLDAIHLASCIILRRITEATFPLITADKRRAIAANSEGFEVIRVGL